MSSVNISADLFTSADCQKILANKYVLFIGDSVVRGMYKDLVKLLQKNYHLTDLQLKFKGEFNFEGDTLLTGGQKGILSNDVTYTEVREFKTTSFHIRFYFITRCYSDYTKSICEDINNEIIKPDLVIMNSGCWDLTRYGMNSLVDYKKNLLNGIASLNNALPRHTLFIWTTIMPLSSDVKGGFMVPEAELHRKTFRKDVLEANNYAVNVIDKFGMDILDLHYYFHNQIQRRAKDGIHWDATAHRRITNLILNHICDAWDLETPGRIIMKNDVKNEKRFKFSESTEINDMERLDNVCMNFEGFSPVENCYNSDASLISSTNFKKRRNAHKITAKKKGRLTKSNNFYKFESSIASSNENSVSNYEGFESSSFNCQINNLINRFFKEGDFSRFGFNGTNDNGFSNVGTISENKNYEGIKWRNNNNNNKCQYSNRMNNSWKQNNWVNTNWEDNNLGNNNWVRNWNNKNVGNNWDNNSWSNNYCEKNNSDDNNWECNNWENNNWANNHWENNNSDNNNWENNNWENSNWENNNWENNNWENNNWENHNWENNNWENHNLDTDIDYRNNVTDTNFNNNVWANNINSCNLQNGRGKKRKLNKY